MKELLIDFTMVGLLLFCMNGLLNNHYIKMKWFLKILLLFEQKCTKNKKEVNSDEGLYDNQKDNTLSLIVKKDKSNLYPNNSNNCLAYLSIY